MSFIHGTALDLLLPTPESFTEPLPQSRHGNKMAEITISAR